MSLIDKVCETKPSLKFSSYHKYSFNFEGGATLPNGDKVSISAAIGGDTGCIYIIEALEVLSKDKFSYINVKNLTTGEEETWSDY